jgi:ABC-type uncharacterized transport system permease subunit
MSAKPPADPSPAPRADPGPAVLACLLFGAAEALQIRLQTSGGFLPDWIIQAVPYALTVAVLAGLGRGPGGSKNLAAAPAALAGR